MEAILKEFKAKDVDDYCVDYTTISATNTIRIFSQYDNSLPLSLEGFFCLQSEPHTIQEVLNIFSQAPETAVCSL